MLEDNLENKAKFFAQYWGQKVLSYMVGDIRIYDSKVFFPYGEIVEGHYLELKPLSAISDEDARYLGYESAISVTTTYSKTLGTSSYESDYLRDKGYLVPFNGLSCEELLNRGWAVLESEVKNG